MKATTWQDVKNEIREFERTLKSNERVGAATDTFRGLLTEVCDLGEGGFFRFAFHGDVNANERFAHLGEPREVRLVAIQAAPGVEREGVRFTRAR